MRRQGLQHPARLIPLAFLGLIVVGTALLMLPVSVAGERSAPLLTALFTATSAVCVTGLTVEITPLYWSTFGQLVIMVLFQIGGLGIMTGSTLLALLVSRRLRLGTRLLAQAETRSLGLGDVAGVLKLILAVTLCIELLVAAAISARLHFFYGESWGLSLWNGLFHAVSAFNNAGFSTYADNLVGFVSDPFVLLPIMLAIVIGGLGFPILYEMHKERGDWARWSLHTKITLLGSVVLLLGGTVALLAYEWSNTFATLGTGDKLLNALFQSINARTSGFNSVDFGQLRSESLAVHYVLMFIGGGSASTAGGIKVATFFLLGYVVWAEIRGARDVTAFGRRIASDTQRQALAVVLLGVSVLSIATLALQSVTDLPLDVLIFEAISAFATVGLSTGITADLPASGQLILIVLMYVGRVGTITVATALALRSRPEQFRYPEEHPVVG